MGVDIERSEIGYGLDYRSLGAVSWRGASLDSPCLEMILVPEVS